jgi:hypothetical protein
MACSRNHYCTEDAKMRYELFVELPKLTLSTVKKYRMLLKDVLLANLYRLQQ